MVTLYDVARLAGVSTATVSRVVHGQEGVRETTRTRVRQAIEELGYVPDGAAQSLSRRRKDAIGLVCRARKVDYSALKDAGLLYYDQVLHGVEEHIHRHDTSLLIDFIHEDKTGQPDIRRLDALPGKVDGILLGEGFVTGDYIERLATRIPVVVIAGAPGEQVTDVVAADNFSGAASLITHLVADHGKRRLFHVDGPPDSPDAAERRRALHHVLGGNPHCQLIGSARGFFDVRSGEKAGEDLLAKHRGDLPDAVVCANDQMAIGMLRALAAAGVRVPAEVAVVGFDDIYRASVSDPPLTTVQQPMQMLGRQALRPPARPHRRPGAAPRARSVPDRTGAPHQLRLSPDTLTHQQASAGG